jgi:hypothetical protein
MRNAFAAVMVVVVLGGVACGTSWPQFIRAHTYPPDFSYVSEDELRSSMWVLGRDTLELRRVLADRCISEETRRTRVELLLGAMEGTVQQIGPTQWSTNHPELKSALEALESDVHAAREGVKHDPPTYFLAGSVSGACLYCHRQ